MSEPMPLDEMRHGQYLMRKVFLAQPDNAARAQWLGEMAAKMGISVWRLVVFMGVDTDDPEFTRRYESAGGDDE